MSSSGTGQKTWSQTNTWFHLEAGVLVRNVPTPPSGRPGTERKRASEPLFPRSTLEPVSPSLDLCERTGSFVRSISSSTVESNLQVINFSKHKNQSMLTGATDRRTHAALCPRGTWRCAPSQGSQLREEVELFEYTYFRAAPLNLRSILINACIPKLNC